MSENATVRRIPWHMSCQLRVGAFHSSGPSASAPVMRRDQIVPLTVPYDGRRRGRVFSFSSVRVVETRFFFVKELL
jgi:hypothetical protein